MDIWQTQVDDMTEEELDDLVRQSLKDNPFE